MEIADVQKSVEGINKAFAEFKSEMKKSVPDAAVLAKIQADLDAHDKIVNAHAEEKKKLSAQLDSIETKLNRIEIGGGAGKDKRATRAAERKAAFGAMLRYGMEHEATAKWERAEAERKAGNLEWADAPIEKKTLVASDDTAGGYLAPPEYLAEIIKAVVLMSPVRDLVKVKKISARSTRQPKRTAVSSATWVGETTTRVEATNPAYGLVEVVPYELTAEHYVSMQELEDSAFDLEGELRQEFAEQFAVAEGVAFVTGNGVAKPWGITDAGSAIPTFNSGSAGTIQDANGQANGIIKLFHGVKTAYANNGKWLLARATLGSVRSLQDSQKRYLWQPSPALGMPSTILGAPYVEVPDMPLESANAFPMAFGDWQRCYTLVDRISMDVLRDPYSKGSVGQIKFVARRRVGGQVVLAEAAALLKCHT